MRRPFALLLATTLFFAAFAMLAGCEDAVPLKPEEQKIAVGAEFTALCPDASNDYLSETSIIATVFGNDGSVAGDETVIFTTTDGSLEESSVATDPTTGQAVTVVSIPRKPAEGLVTITGTLESSGEADTIEVVNPLLPLGNLLTFADIYGIGAEIDLQFMLRRSCDVSEVRFVLTYDPTVVEVAPAPVPEGEPIDPTVLDIQETGALNQVTVDEIIPTELSYVHQPGRLQVISYKRIDDPLTGLTVSGQISFLVIVFEALAEGDPNFGLESITLLPSDGGPPWEITPDEFTVSEVSVIDASGD